MLPHQLPLYGVVVSGNSGHIDFKGGRGQPTLQPLLQKRKHSSDRTSPGVLLVWGSPFDEQVSLQSIGRLVDGAHAEAIVSATCWGRSPRTSASHPGTTHLVSTSLDVGARGCPISEKADPSSEESAREGLSRGAWVLGTRSCWTNMEPLTRPAPRPPWSCTVSVLVGSLGGAPRPPWSCTVSVLVGSLGGAPRPPWSCTVSVLVGSLGGTHICAGPGGQLCASASVPSIVSVRE